MKKLIFFCLGWILLLLPSVSMTAQTQISENYLITGPFTDYVAPMKYSYTVSDEGERIMNGPISISGKQNETYGNVTITGSYVLNASAKDGNLNGQMSVKANYHGVKQLIRGQQVDDYAYSFSGSFLNGIPNGTFSAKATNFGSSTVTYKQGVLVGAYSVDEVIDDRILTIKGSFDNVGNMVGVWNIKNLGDAEVWEFVNGVRIRLSSKKSESTPKQIEMAKKYASGAITKEALEEEGYFPMQDSIALGDYANDLYFLNYIANWKKLAGCSFGEAKWVKYTYLYNLLPVPEKKFDEILSEYRNSGDTHYPFVKYNELIKAFTIEYPSDHVVICRRFTEAQIMKINEARDHYCRENPLSLSNLFHVTNVDYSLEEKARELESRYEKLKEITNINTAYSSHKSLVKDFEDVSETLKKILDGKEMTSDGLFYIVPGEKPLTAHYYSASSLENYDALEKEVMNYKSTLDKAKEDRKSAIVQGFLSELSEIEKQSASKTSEQLKSMTVKEYKYTPNNSLNITSAEFAEAIAPVQEYSIIDVKDEENTYRITIEFINKKGTVPVSMSMTSNGKIIDGSITIPEDILDTVRKKVKNKQSVSNALNNAINKRSVSNIFR